MSNCGRDCLQIGSVRLNFGGTIYIVNDSRCICNAQTFLLSMLVQEPFVLIFFFSKCRSSVVFWAILVLKFEHVELWLSFQGRLMDISCLFVPCFLSESLLIRENQPFCRVQRFWILQNYYYGIMKLLCVIHGGPKRWSFPCQLQSGMKPDVCVAFAELFELPVTLIIVSSWKRFCTILQQNRN